MSISPPLPFHRSLLALAWATLILLGLGAPARAVIDDNATKQIWKLKYGVTDAQVKEQAPYVGWLNKDDDGDGVKNMDEIAAGTNPFSAGSVVKITGITNGGTTVNITFPTEAGKQYVVQATQLLTNPFTSTADLPWTGTGVPKTLTVTKGANKFFRILVQDVDSDGDGVSNWAEQAVGVNPNIAETISGMSTLAYVNQQIAIPNVVTITAATPFASEDGPTAGKFTVTRTQDLFPITVNYSVAGTAVPVVDYASLGTGLIFPARGAMAQDIFVNPIMQAPAIKGGRSVTATLTPPAGAPFPFTLSSPNNTATVIINGSTVATGTGLLGRYYDTTSGTQTDAGNFGQAGMYAFTRGAPTTTGTIVVTYAGGTIPGLVVGNQVKVSFTSGSLNNALYNNFSYPVTAVTASSFTLSITAASAFGFTSTNGNCNFSIQSFTHPATVTRVDPTVNFDWAYGTPNGNVITPNNSPDNYSSTWDAYLQPTTAGNYIFQLDADDKARVLLDTGSGLTQIVEHNWVSPGSDPVGTFKQSASIPLVVPATPAQRYHIRVEHVETTGDARCRLQWNVNGGSFGNIPQANQFTHTQAMAYSYTAGNAVVTPTGGHSFIVGNTVPLSFSSGVLFTPGAAGTYNGTYTITAVNGTTTYTVAIAGFPVSVPGAATTAGNPNIIVPSTAGLAVGMAVSGTGLPSGEFITAITGSANGPGLISVTTGTGVITQASTTITAVLPATGTTTGNGFVLNNTTSITTGLYNLIYPNTAFSGSPGRVGIDAAVTTGNNGIWGAGTPDPLIQPDTFSVRWTGQVQPQYSETYTFNVTADDGCALWINGQPQVLKMSPSALTGGSNYLYDSIAGNVMINYSGLAVPSGSYAIGETARPDFSNGNLNNAPTTSCTYDYEPTTGIMVVDYTNLTIGQPGGTRVAGSYAVGDTVEIDPTSGGLSALSNLPYTITATLGNTFSIQIGTVNFTPTIAISGISAASPCEVTAAQNHGLTTGTQVRISSVSSGTFTPAINGLYTITVTGPRTFTVASNCTVAPTAGSGTFSVSGNVAINDSRNLVISKLYASGSTYTYNTVTGATVISYSALNLPANSFTAGSVELAGTTNALASVKSASYPITASTANTFTVTFPTGIAGTGTGNINIAAPVGGPIPASGTNAFTVNVGTGKYADLSSGSVNLDIVNKTLKDWSSNGNERYVRIPMIGGVRYDIQLDYYEGASYAKCVLSWFSPSQPKQVIPQERLYPTRDTVVTPTAQLAPAAQITPTDAIGLVGGLFSLPIAGSNGGAVTISGNPAWLTYNSSTGLLSGTPPVGASGDYQIIITIVNTTGTTTTSTSVVNLHVDANAGNVVREYWSGVAGTTVASIPTTTTPTGTANLTTLQGPTDFGDNYGARVTGYITAPTTGNYYFWIAASNAAELWISNDAEPVNAFKRAWVTTGNATSQTWNGEANQKSAWLALEQGKKYYVQILHKAGVGVGDNLAVGWAKPGDPTTVPSEVVPGYALSPYVAPPSGPTSGTLYLATMLAQPPAVSNGVGSSTLLLSADENTGYMKFSASGFAPLDNITSKHIHADPYLSHPTAIIFDIDTPVTAGDGLITNPSDPNYGSYKWTILGVGTLSKADIIEIIKEGKTYINLHTTLYPNGEIRGNYTLAGGSQTFTAPPAPPSWTDDHATANSAARFLAQATFGANPADISALQGMASYDAWINDQFGKSATHHLPEVLAREIGDVFGAFDVRVCFATWWKCSITGQDQLRQRVACALSEILVTSANGLVDRSDALAHYYDTLLDDSFGNFRNVLQDITLTPGMGQYLNMLLNDKPDISVGRSPNENYAREIQQLFSIGLYRMWPDGSLILDSTNAPIPTYTQREIVGFAHVFTGWDYGYDGAYLTSLSSPINWTRPMREVPVRHFTGQKRILNNEVLPGLPNVGGQPLDAYANHISTQYNDPTYQVLPAQENSAVHDQLFNHPNTGPFICRQLIQRLVTSNPSRDYLYRVVQKFNDNGSGVRGDMQAVIKAILLDYEARSGTIQTQADFGKQREPMIRVAQAVRAFRPGNITGTYSQSGTNLITITTSAPHLLQSNNSVFLEFTDATPVTAQPAPTTGNYTVTVTDATHYTIAAPGWVTGAYSQTAGSNVMTITMNGHWLPGDNANVIPTPQVLPAVNKGQAYFNFTSGTASGLAGFDQTIRTVNTSTSYDVASGVGTSATLPSVNGNYSGTTFTIIAPDTTARSGNVMIARFSGSYSCTGRAGVITIDTSYGGITTYGVMADHGLSVGDQVFLNFLDTRDTTSGSPTSTANDVAYTIANVPDPNTFKVVALDVANAAMNSDDLVIVFPLKAQPLVRNGTVNTRMGTFTMDNTDTDLTQTPLNAPTVFNYFLPGYKYPGALASQGLTTPEFQITAETTVVSHANFIYNGIFNPSNTTGLSSFKSGTNALVMDFSPWMGNAVNTAGSIGFILGNGALGTGQQIGQVWTSNANLPTLIDRLNTLLLGGQLPGSAKATIQAFIGGQISSIAVGSPCTITMGAAHNLAVGDSVTITGITGGTFNTGGGNGTFTVASVPTSTTLTLTGLNCTSTAGLVLTSSTLGIIPYTNAPPTATNIRDRLRAILHLILTSPDYTIQR